MASSAIKGKSAKDTLLDKFSEIVDAGAAGMSKEELRKSEKRFNDVLDSAAASRKSRRKTA
jgi:hypothetical protein